MNTSTKLIAFILLNSLFSCNASKSLQEVVFIEQTDSDFPVLIRGNLDKDKIFSINFPLAFKYQNKSSIKKKISRVNYYKSEKLDTFDSGYWEGGIILYEDKNGVAQRIDSHFSNINPIKNDDSQNIVIYTKHDVGELIVIQSELKSYLEKIKERGIIHGKDTLSISTFKEFKEKHPDLIKMLLEGDSIRFRVSDIDNKSDTLIVLPIRY